MSNPTLRKIYTDDPNLPYKTTKLKALYTKSEIDGILAKFGIHKVGWNWNLAGNEVYVIFDVAEVINGTPVGVTVRVDAFPAWEHKTRANPEHVNWDISMRTMYWFIKSLLEAAYLHNSSKTAMFLPYIVGADGKTNFSEKVIPKLAQLDETLALADQRKETEPNNKRMIIDVTPPKEVQNDESF